MAYKIRNINGNSVIVWKIEQDVREMMSENTSVGNVSVTWILAVCRYY